MTEQLRIGQAPKIALWLYYTAFCGWLAGPLLAAAAWLLLGDGDGDRGFALSPLTGLVPLGGFVLVAGFYTTMTKLTLALPLRRAAGRAAGVLAAGWIGWIIVWFIDVPTQGSLSLLTLAWLALTVPYPAAAALLHRNAGARTVAKVREIAVEAVALERAVVEAVAIETAVVEENP